VAYTYFLYRIAGVVFLAKYRSHAAAGIRTRLPTRVVLISRRPISLPGRTMARIGLRMMPPFP